MFHDLHDHLISQELLPRTDFAIVTFVVIEEEATELQAGNDTGILFNKLVTKGNNLFVKYESPSEEILLIHSCIKRDYVCHKNTNKDDDAENISILQVPTFGYAVHVLDIIRCSRNAQTGSVQRATSVA